MIFYFLFFHFRGVSMVFSENDMVKCVKKRGCLAQCQPNSEIQIFFFFIRLKFFQEINKDYLYNRFVILLIEKR